MKLIFLSVFLVFVGCTPKANRFSINEGSFFAYAALGPPFLDIRSFDVNCRLELFRTDKDVKEYAFKTAKNRYRLEFLSNGGKINIYRGIEPIIDIDLASAIKGIGATKNFAVPQPLLTIDKNNVRAKVRLYVFNVSGRKTEKGFVIYYLKSDLLFSDSSVDTVTK